MSHATPADMIVYFDETVLADLLSDTGTPAEVATDPKLLAMLDAASGRIESALTVADQYTAADLAALTGTSQALLKELTCTLAMALALRRRPGSKHEEVYKPAIEGAEEFLDRLRKGERVFGGAAAQRDAGLPAIDGPTLAEYDRLGLLRDRVRNYFPRRSLPFGR